MECRWGSMWLLCCVVALGGCSVHGSADRTPAAVSGQAAPASPSTVVAVPTSSAAATSETHVAGSTPSAATSAALEVPFPPPPGCAATPWHGHERRHDFPAFWLDAGGLAAGDPAGPVLFAGAQKIQWQAAVAESRELSVTGTRLDDAAATTGANQPVPLVEHPVPLDAGVWSTSMTFPEAGCWRLQATSGTHAFAAIVYVFPAACRPPELRQPGATPGECRPPG